MDSRQQFEEWSANHEYLGGTGLFMVDDRYKDIDVQHAWESWQASRESLVILLVPPHNDCENYSDSQVSGAYKYYGQAIKHIHAAGIRTE